MNPNRTFFALILMLLSAQASAQYPQQQPKLDGALSLLLSPQRDTRASARTFVYHGTRRIDLRQDIPLTIHSDRAATVAARIQADGHHAAPITDNFLTARVPLDYVRRIADMDEVKHLNLARRFRPLLNRARPGTGVDSLHAGTGLTTPYTGKGVVLGVIDQGFQFDHIAFTDENGQSRVRAVWNRRKNRMPQEGSNLPTGGESEDSHATHVTAIAAGRNLGNGYQGIAPGAEIIMIPSDFTESEVTEDVRYIKDFAEKQGKPWVVNMSFGEYLGSHDGLSDYDQAIAQLTGKGGLIAAAMGNARGERLHASATISPGKPRYLLIEQAPKDLSGIVALTLWNQNTDGQKHLKVTPFLYYNRTIEERNDAFWQNQGSATSGIQPRSKKEYYDFTVQLHHIGGLVGNSDVKFGVKIELADGQQQPQTIHAWTTEDRGHFSAERIAGHAAATLQGDDEYLVGEGGAAIPTAIAVGSYTTATSFVTLSDQKERSIIAGEIGARSDFSTSGPFLNPDYPKPAVLAPGSLITSAYNRYDNETPFSATAKEITALYQQGNSKHYYGVMQGTSMASPFVAGVLCLWLEANPELTYEQVIRILAQTSRRDKYFEAERTDPAQNWTTGYGYGKIDAYEGLKAVLRLPSAIRHVENSAAPISIRKTPDAWQLLFNNGERFAHIALYTPDGRLVRSHQLGTMNQGDEFRLDLTGLRTGAYLLNLRTVGSNVTHRLLVP